MPTPRETRPYWGGIGEVPLDSHEGGWQNSGALGSMHYLQRICYKSPKPYLRLADVKSNIAVIFFFSGAWGFGWRNWMLVMVEKGFFMQKNL